MQDLQQQICKPQSQVSATVLICLGSWLPGFLASLSLTLELFPALRSPNINMTWPKLQVQLQGLLWTQGGDRLLNAL